MLQHKAARSFTALIAPPGTGKSNILDEVILQMIQNHKEDCPGSAL
jgi:predicted NACHT family NTPase